MADSTLEGLTLEVLIQEVVAAEELVAEPLEGLEDFQSLDLEPETMEEVKALLAQYLRRRDKLQALRVALQAALAAMNALLEDGHPTLPLSKVSESSLDDMAGNLTTLLAASKKFSLKPLGAVMGRFQVGPEIDVP